MGDIERRTKDKIVDYKLSAAEYGELIIEAVHGINDRWILEQIYRYIRNMTKEG